MILIYHTQDFPVSHDCLSCQIFLLTLISDPAEICFEAFCISSKQAVYWVLLNLLAKPVQ